MTNKSRTPLPLHTNYLLRQRYQLEKVIGFGGFSITYLATDTFDNTQTAIKEYFPSQFAVRENSGCDLSVRPVSGSERIYFEQGLLQIKREAELLRHFSELESIVSLYDCFEENNTIYLVMEFIEGITLKQYIQDTCKMDFPRLLSLMTPILQELSAIHREGLYHRDITPDNLILGTDNRLHLIDFGAAKQNNSLSKKNTVILQTGYAPPEQYLPDGKLGPWVDVYGICATMFFCLTAISPADALQRTENEIFDILQENTNIQSFEIAALCKGMSLRIADRFSDTEALLRAFLQKDYGEHTVLGSDLSKSQKKAAYRLNKSRIDKKIGISTIFILIISAIIGPLLFFRHSLNDQALMSSHRTEFPFEQTGNSYASGSAVTSAAAQETVSGAASSSLINKTSPDDAILTMPKLSGQKVKQAKKTVENLDSSIQIKIIYKYKKNKKTGIVLDQSIPAGTSFVSGQIKSVLLTINKKKAASGKANTDNSSINNGNQTTSSPTPDRDSSSKDSQNFTIKTQEPYVSVPLG